MYCPVLVQGSMGFFEVVLIIQKYRQHTSMVHTALALHHAEFIKTLSSFCSFPKLP